jgi:hypothetical protein
MAARWAASAADLHEVTAPTGLGLPCQTSAAAVEAADADVTAFSEGLAARAAGHAAGGDGTNGGGIAVSTAALTALYQPAVSD